MVQSTSTLNKSIWGKQRPLVLLSLLYQKDQLNCTHQLQLKMDNFDREFAEMMEEQQARIRQQQDEIAERNQGNEVFCQIVKGEWENVHQLVDQGADVNQIGVGTKTRAPPLTQAIILNAPQDVIQALVTHPKMDLDKMNSEGETALHVQIKKKKWETVKLLLNQGADINLRIKNVTGKRTNNLTIGQTPLMQVIGDLISDLDEHTDFRLQTLQQFEVLEIMVSDEKIDFCQMQEPADDRWYPETIMNYIVRWKDMLDKKLERKQEYIRQGVQSDQPDYHVQCFKLVLSTILKKRKVQKLFAQKLKLLGVGCIQSENYWAMPQSSEQGQEWLDPSNTVVTYDYSQYRGHRFDQVQEERLLLNHQSQRFQRQEFVEALYKGEWMVAQIIEQNVEDISPERPEGTWCINWVCDATLQKPLGRTTLRYDCYRTDIQQGIRKIDVSTNEGVLRYNKLVQDFKKLMN